MDLIRNVTLSYREQRTFDRLCADFAADVNCENSCPGVSCREIHLTTQVKWGPALGWIKAIDMMPRTGKAYVNNNFLEHAKLSTAFPKYDLESEDAPQSCPSGKGELPPWTEGPREVL